LWLAVLYLSRAITLPIAMAIGHVAGVDPMAIAKFRDFWNAYELIPSLIAAVILITLFRRVPAAPAWMRSVWAHGRMLLAVAAIVDIALLLLSAMRQEGVNNSLLESMAPATVDACFLVYILSARRVRHVFAEFPPPVK
jgi:uncharacterized membrane protein YeaQ/YmgE (transglycosylase-associated protein family)